MQKRLVRRLVLADDNSISTPVTWSEIHRSAFLHAVHYLIDTPGLICVSWWEIWWYIRLIETNTLLHGSDIFVVIFIGITLHIVRPNPFWMARLSSPGFRLDLPPICVLEELGVSKPQFLCASNSSESVRESARQSRLHRGHENTESECEPAPLQLYYPGPLFEDKRQSIQHLQSPVWRRYQKRAGRCARCLLSGQHVRLEMTNSVEGLSTAARS